MKIKNYLPIINEVIEIVDMPNAVRKRAAVKVTWSGAMMVDMLDKTESRTTHQNIFFRPNLEKIKKNKDVCLLIISSLIKKLI